MPDSGWRRVARAIVAIGLVFAALATLLSAGARWSWFCDLFTHFRPQLALGFALAGVAAYGLRARRLALYAAAGFVVNALFMLPVVWPVESPRFADGRAVRVLSFNVAYFNRDFAALGPFLESSGADVVALQEVPPRELARLVERTPGYAHRFLDAATGQFGVVVLSRWPLADTRVLDLGVPGRPGAQVTVMLPDSRLTLTALHLVWPLGGEVSAQRDTQLRALASVLADCHGPSVAVGDFNITRWSPNFQRLVRESGMRDCAQGVFVPQTWPSWRLPLRIRIDQCLVDAGTEVVRVSAGPPAAGSDHLPTFNDLRIARD